MSIRKLRPIRNQVLIEQTMTKKESNLILPDKDTKDQQEDLDMYDVTFKVIALGAACPDNEVKVGDCPVMSKHCQHQVARRIDDNTDDKVIIMQAIIDYDDIVGIEE